ncbi:MAG: TlyA family RNA methyltransferase [Austwickia sp.]|jgi:23S rRNA (cytidine1920-2'-O)/16S rRNA (cytidine1409-2'-O)-methyltransferase|nr:MAG: TlyA family RNA methyltransferase [Austwickia sp.]
MSDQRLDVALVARGLARSRGAAADLVKRGAVLVNDAAVRRPAHPVRPGDELRVESAGPEWVGRAARKLVAAFDAFGGVEPEPWSVGGQRCVDVGASTGGFTQVLLDRGAASVVALDVGRDQLAGALRSDPRVIEMSGRSVRGIVPSEVGGPFGVLVADLSFISLRLVATDLAGLVAPGGQGVLLVKPQFEVGRARLGKSGVVRRAAERIDAVAGVLEAYRAAGLFPRAVTPTRVPGGSGNHEYLVWVTTRAEFALPDDTAAAAHAVRSFEGR